MSKHGYESDGSSTDGNRKRQNTSDLFGKSKRTPRSPMKVTQQTAGTEDLKNMMAEMMREIKEMRSEQTKHFAVIEKVNEEIEELRKENRELKERIALVEGKVDRGEKQQKKNNIVIKGKDFYSNIHEVEKFCKEVVGVQVKIESVQGGRVGATHNVITVVKLSSWKEKELIMKNKNKLKGSKIYIDHDLTKEELAIQRILRERAGKERNEEK